MTGFDCFSRQQTGSIPERTQLTAQSASVDAFGRAVIPDSIVKIAANAFCGRPDLRFVMLPSSVRTIEAFAFAQCPNLLYVQLNEGLERLGYRVFADCPQLQPFGLPGSLHTIQSGTFDRLPFRSPLFDRTQSILFRHYGSSTDKQYVVPASVKQLSAGAFSNDAPLEEVMLPQQLETIDAFAFSGAGIRQITLPASLKLVRDNAFSRCTALERIDILCAREALCAGMLANGSAPQIYCNGKPADYELTRFLTGIDLLAVKPHLQPPSEDLWTEPPFAALAAQCACGSSQAMLELAKVLESHGASSFFSCASNFWRYRACQYGNPEAEAWKKHWLQLHPQSQIPSAMHAHLQGDYSGQYLRALGFGFFEPARFYHLHGLDRNNLVEVSSWCDADEPDEDGFGREEYYDWWLLDEHLQPIPGVDMLHEFSLHERREYPAPFRSRYDAALAARNRAKDMRQQS